MAVVLASFAAVVPFDSLTRPSHIDNKTWYGYRLENVVYHAHSRVHAVALLLDRDWHDGTCEQAAAAGLWFDYVGKVCNVWMRVLAAQDDEGSVEEDVVLYTREVMRVIDDSWQNLRHMTGRRDPAEQAFGDGSRFTATVPANGVQFEDPGALIGFMWRTVLYAHANVSTSKVGQHNTSAWKAVRDTYLDAVAYEHADVPLAGELSCFEDNEHVSFTPLEARRVGPLQEHEHEDYAEDDVARLDIEVWLSEHGPWWQGANFTSDSMHRAIAYLHNIYEVEDQRSGVLWPTPKWATRRSEEGNERARHVMDRRYDGHHSLRTREYRLGGRDQTGERCPKSGVCGGFYDEYEDQHRGYLETKPVTARRIEAYMSRFNYYWETEAFC